MRSAREIKSLRDIGLGRALSKTLEQHGVEEVIQAARLGNLTSYSDIGEVRTRRITEKLQELDLLFEESPRSQAMRRLLTALYVLPDIRRPEVYEAQREFNDQQLTALTNVVLSLPGAQADVVRCYYGLEDGVPLGFRACGRELGISHETARKQYSLGMGGLSLSKRLVPIQKILRESGQAVL